MNRFAVVLAFVMLTFVSCSGGGGGDGGEDSSGGGPSESGTETWRAEAVLTVDGCRERTATVTQNFSIVRNGDTVSIDDTLVKVTGVATADGFTFSHQGASGECVRSYDGQFSNMTDTTADVHFTVTSNCGTGVCQNQWTGTAALTSSTSREDELQKIKISGENCVPPIPQIGYRPSLFECFGNAAVLARGFTRGNYSIVVRRIGEFNDRDPNNTSCASTRCSPYKTQQRIELPDYQVNCLGDTGFSANFQQVTRISVKYTAAIEDKNDPTQFEQYCLASRTTDLN